MATPKPLKLNTIPFADVQAALHSSTALDPQRQFNTHEHSINEISHALPQLSHLKPDTTQLWLLLRPWLDLIVESQGIDHSAVHTIKLPGWYCDDLVNPGRTWQLSRRAPVHALDDLADAFPKWTTNGRLIEEVLKLGRRYFVRLDTCSLKDAETLPSVFDSAGGLTVGNVPVTEPSQLWHRVVTSTRGCSGVADIRAAGEDVFLYLLPWREDVGENGVEFCIFCAPGGGLVAVSQYVWHAPLKLPNDIDLDRWCRWVYEGIDRIYGLIVQSAAYTNDVQSAGFTFDVLVVGQDIQLVELHTSSALTGCGSCLFHWIKDAELLYGLRDEVELRVSR